MIENIIAIWERSRAPESLFCMEIPMKNQKTPLLAIRQHCLECSGGIPKEVRYCHITDCPLYEYRFGKNPNRKGIGRKDNLNRDMEKEN